MIRECVICGTEFRPRGPQKTCSSICSRKNKTLRISKWKKENLSKEELAEQSRRWRSNNYQKYREKDNERSRVNHWKNRERRLSQKIEYNKNNPESHVRYLLKNKLGFTPDDELVELATMRRLINRAIRKAGE